MQKTIILLIAILLTSCSFKQEATGKENEIIILVSPEDRIFVQPQLEQLFSKFINTPHPLTVSFSKVIINGDNVDTFTF